MMQPDGQLAFDFDEFEREDARNDLASWQGAPLHFTTDYYSPAELDRAFRHWQFLYGSFGSIPNSHMWHRSAGAGGVVSFGDHSIVTFTAELRPDHGQLGPGDLLYQANCEPCGWHTVSNTENDVVEAWHDHGVPGWRELPIIPAQIRLDNGSGLTKMARTWIAEHYPKHMQIPGTPIIRSGPVTALVTSVGAPLGAAMTLPQSRSTGPAPNTSGRNLCSSARPRPQLTQFDRREARARPNLLPR